MNDLKSANRLKKAPNQALSGWITQAGFSYQELAVELKRAAVADGRPDMARDRTRISHWVRDGEQPRPPIPEYLAQILTLRCRLSIPLTPSDLGMPPPDTRLGPLLAQPASPLVAPDQAGDPTKRRTAVSLVAAALTSSLSSIDTARAYTQHATATDLAPGDVERLDLAVHRIGTTYSARSPRELWPIVAAHRYEAFTLLHTRRHTQREGRHLAHHSGMLSVLLAWITHDLGRKDLVDAYCDDAWEQGQQAGAPQVGAWAEDVRATEALYGGRPLDALAAATRGLAVAPRGGNAAIRLAAQQVRAYAKLGDRQGFTDAAQHLTRDRDSLPLASSGLFAVDNVRLISYEASSWGWLGEHAKARAAATEAITHYSAMSSPYRAPTRLAIAHLDLALAHVATGEPDAAIAAARPVLTKERLVQSIMGRVTQLERRLRASYPALPLATAFSDELHLLTS